MTQRDNTTYWHCIVDVCRSYTTEKRGEPSVEGRESYPEEKAKPTCYLKVCKDN